ncbi:hypothetical protein GCM10029964_119720 [Kibdelosporangium lantanae]
MDEKKLTELFNDAVRDAPPASFGTGEVRRASKRATERRRTAIVGGSVLAVVLLGGGVVTGIALSGETMSSNASAPMVASSGQGDGGGTMYDNGAPPPGPSARVESGQPNDRPEGPKQGGSLTGSAGPSAGSTPGGCEKADRELAAALASELPAAANAQVDDAQPVPFGCPPRSRGASFKVVDGPRSGTLSVVLAPPGSTPGIAPLGAGVPGTTNYNAPALVSGGTVYIVSQPGHDLAEPPFGEIGTALAAGIGQNH